ncbi:NAD-dependent succinate-semialdehyde dehydrogenase [Synechococcus sp. PCC 6312]|uniref:NAD-dependent succinate-semialdehyde dehydrogenase n=1 Tax=Synechococcus sp. (strain ATCC 27167 / PCC 6312) TaxID=195253 RepID=UPI00029EF077|nr:NAD-dependent succinate-semialdehyde dehydrogenase [Synechococcus sp. PCC 6312]AFY59866.1 NAD-dependent aldehyde dehydrogenase [Synechococcus sp. PCC 6312]
MAIASINPTTGDVIQEFTALSDGELTAAVAQAQGAFEFYRHTTFEERATWMLKAAALLVAHREDYARLMTLEMGKPITEAIAEVEKSAWVCRFYAENAETFLSPETIATDAHHSYIAYQPLGVILAVMPWNFPFWQVFRFAAPALMAGNVGLLKHASNVPQCALKIAEIFQAAGFPDHVFQTLLIGANQIAPLVSDPRIKAATLTGSEPAGMSLAQASGHELKKVVLELGGSDPFIVLESADLELAALTAAKARMINNGQSCVAAKRFIVVESVADEFISHFLAHLKNWQIGDPLAPTTQLGPLATPNILAELDQQVQVAVEHGAKILLGGTTLKGSQELPAPIRQGHYYSPTVLTRITPHNPVFAQEFFGPVALIFQVKDVVEAIKLANATPFGLAASGWTNDPQEQTQLIRDIEAGAVFINGMVKSDPRLPFGGIKRSGFGRELGRPGILEFVNIKTVWIK